MKDTQTPDSLLPGELVGPWRVEGYAGRGTYGAVYRARRAGHPGSEPVALKIAVYPSDSRFSREVGLLSRNHHPGMPKLLDQGSWQASDEVAHPYFVMEWIRGRTLYEWARVHNPTCREVLLVLAQVAWTLELLHRGECLHRDVKGDNILVEPEGRAVLTDFGSGTWKGAPPLTEHVMPPNTLQYRSPESLRFEWSHWRTRGAHYGGYPPDDLYALGVAAYRLVTGVYPPPGTDPQALKEQFEVPLPQRRPAYEFNARVVPELSALIERMLAKEPEERGTAREIAEAAESAAEHARPEAHVPFLDLEWPRAEAHVVPVRVVSASSPEPPVAEAEAVPVQVRTERWSPYRESRLRAASLVGGMGVLLVALVCKGPMHQVEMHRAAQVEAPQAEWAPDAGTRLGDDAASTRVETPQAPVTLGAVSQEIPEKPLPGQRRPPCQRRRWEVVINGGCWKLLEGSAPPCGDDEYAWQGGCYVVAWERTRPPTSTKPQ